MSIVDDESIISVVATDSQASEQISVRSIEKGILTLQRTGSRAKLLVVDYSLTGTATNGTDYRLLSGKATFRPGKNKVNVRIVPIADQLPESAEDVVLTLTPSSLYGTDPGATTGEVTITD